MAVFRSDNPTGSAWVDSGSRFRLPQRPERLESDFLAGNYDKASKRRRRKLSRAKSARRQPHSWTASPRESNPTHDASGTAPVHSASATPSTYANMRSVGRLNNVVIAADGSPFAQLARTARNFINSRLTTHKETILDSSGFALDGVELTKQEYDAWIKSDPNSNAFLTIEAASQNGANFDNANFAENAARPVVHYSSDSPSESPAVPHEETSEKEDGKIGNLIGGIFIIIIVLELLGVFFSWIAGIFS